MKKSWTIIFFAILLTLSRCPKAEKRAPIVMIASRNNITEFENAKTAIENQLSGLPVELKVEWVDTLGQSMPSQVEQARKAASRYDAITVFWADLSLPDQIFLFLSQPPGERVLVRHFGPDAGGREGRLVTLAVIVQNSVEAVLEGGKIGIQTPTSPRESPYQYQKTRMEIAAGYGISPYAEGIEWCHGPTFDASLVLMERARIFFGYRVVLPMEINEKGLQMKMRSYPFKLGAALRWNAADWVFEGGVSIIAELLTAAIEQADTSIEKQNPPMKWILGFSPFLSIGWSPSPFATILGAVGFDGMFNQPDFVLQNELKQETVIAPWAVRPYAQIGFVFVFL